ncbi:MAG: type ISP restriction/modification enzyme [Sumerlaeia bacterium]
MSPVEQFLRDISHARAAGGTKETSFYGPLQALLSAVGRDLSPKVEAVMQLRSRGAGIPDGGLFTAQQFRKGEDLQAFAETAPAPERGAIEVKSPFEDATTTAASPQVAKYLDAYGTVLVTNFRDFLLVGRGPDTKPRVLERFQFADSERDFWQCAARARATAEERGPLLLEFLRRVLSHNAPLRSPEDLAWFLASYARDAKARVDAKAHLDALVHVRKAMEGALGIRFEDEKGDAFFRSTLVQTLFYGIFSAWVLWSRENPGREARFDWRLAGWTLRVPMISALFGQIASPTSLRPLDLEEVLDWTAAALNRVDRSEFFARFRDEDAVQYFYEPFLQAFDPDLRKDLGVWYTPREIVRYMVARVDRALREELGIASGLADPRVTVLDPCCGTGAFLVEVLRTIRHTLEANGEDDALLGTDLRRAACERVFGFELLPAPFVVAHLQIGLELQKHGAALRQDDNERAGIFLTNALTGWAPPDAAKKRVLVRGKEGKAEERIAQQTRLDDLAAFPELASERDAANAVKRDKQILVILGNPPYNGFAGIARMEEERDLSEAYRTPPARDVPKPQGQGLNDLYVRFFRMAEHKIVEDSGQGIVCYISNYSWLDGLSFPVMRHRYLDVFDRVWIDNLHGNRIISEYNPEGKISETVFAIQGQSLGIKVGTGIGLLVRKEPGGSNGAEVRYRDFHEARASDRRDAMLRSLEETGEGGYRRVEPEAPLGFPFLPSQTSEGYFEWPKLPELFPVSFPGIITARDELLVDHDQEALVERMEMYFDPEVDDAALAAQVPCAAKETGRFPAKDARSQLLQRGFLPDRVRSYLHRPFDLRSLYWEPETKLVEEKRSESFPHFTLDNLWLVSGQRPRKGFYPPLVSRSPCSFHLIENCSLLFPLRLAPTDTGDLFDTPTAEPSTNLSDAAARYLAGLGAGPEALFFHALAILHSPRYRQENAGALRQDWPRVPLPRDRAVLEASEALGRRVAALLDPEADVQGVTSGAIAAHLREMGVLTPRGKDRLDPDRDLAVRANWGYRTPKGAIMPAKGRSEERDFALDEQAALATGAEAAGLDLDTALALLGHRTHDVFLSDAATWRNVPEQVWDYTLGGYLVVKKWLSYREEKVLGRALRPEEARHVTAMVRRIAELLLLGPGLDGNYEAAKGGGVSTLR